MSGFSTIAVHGAALKKEQNGALRFPVYEGVSFEFDTANDIALAFEGKKPAHSYSRISNPTVEHFEQTIRVLAGAQAVVAVSSGMAAISNLVMALAESGSNFVVSKFMFGNTVSLFEETLGPWGLKVKYVDMTDLDAVDSAVDGNTRGIFFEVITNPQLQVPDARALSEIARKHSIPLIVDGTVTTPYLFRSRDFGVDVEVLSSTKYISGGATGVGGLIIDNGTYNWQQNPKLAERARRFGPFALVSKLRQEVYRNLGACLSPHNAALQTLGLETLSLRVSRSCVNTHELARHIMGFKGIFNVNYPGLGKLPGYQVAKVQFPHGFGGILTFELEGREKCFNFIDKLKLIKRSTNINDNKTLILHPASTIFCEYSDEQKAGMGVSDSLLRLSVGIEDLKDILEDIKQALEAVS